MQNLVGAINGENTNFKIVELCLGPLSQYGKQPFFTEMKDTTLLADKPEDAYLRYKIVDWKGEIHSTNLTFVDAKLNLIHYAWSEENWFDITNSVKLSDTNELWVNFRELQSRMELGSYVLEVQMRHGNDGLVFKTSMQFSIKGTI